tara:strand:- start:13542 stop:13892 length:351 start_codon:yes stop_codon:yes gene_type:complete
MKLREKVDRPWGRFFVIQDDNDYKIKRIEVNSGHRLSYQYHKKRSEHWIIVKGKATITLENKTIIKNPGESIYIPKGVSHRIQNNNTETLVIIEIQLGTYFGEDDIVRIEDDYNRK